MIDIDFQAGGILFHESREKVYFCAMIDTLGDSMTITLRHFLARDDAHAQQLLDRQIIEDRDTGFSRRFSKSDRLKTVLRKLNMEVSDPGTLCQLEED